MTISLANFVRAHQGRIIDFDGMFGGQCVDLVDQYCHDVLGRPIIWANAIDWYGRDPGDYTWTRNNPAARLQLPPVGSIIVWGPNAKIGTGTLGHIAVVLDVDRAGFTSFDQNWPIGSACHRVRHSYAGVIGWGVARARAVTDHPAPAPAPAPTPPPVSPPAPVPTPAPIPPPEVPPMDVPPVVEIPEAVPVAEAGTTSSEWKAFLIFAGQAAAATTVGALAHFGLHVSDATLGLLVQIELGLGGVAAAYILSRGIRKHGAT